MPNFGLIVLILIIVIDVFAIAFVLRLGGRHDAHRDVREVHHSKAVSRLYELYNTPEAPVIAASPSVASLNTAPSPDAHPDLHTEAMAEELHQAVAELQSEEQNSAATITTPEV